ncbi:MAG: glycoside hydrolase N-terminal domain-containing protein [Eubacteriales bacterium]|nr:glycoside hydrolase N-terminal domain-containing protein [Eubacteriales bacterium]
MQITRNTLYMRYPSSWWHDLWREGLVSGNGAIGINIYGGSKKETMVINHHDLWHGKKCTELPDVSDAFQELRRKMDEENFQEASWTVVNALKERGYEGELESCLPLANIKIEYAGGKGFSDYLRWMQMDSGEVGQKWKDQGTQYASTAFVSRPEQMIAKRIVSDGETLDVTVDLDMHRDEKGDVPEPLCSHILESAQKRRDDDCLVYYARNDDGTWYGCVVQFRFPGGKAEDAPRGVRLTGCREVLLYGKVFVKKAESEVPETIRTLETELRALADSYENYLQCHKNVHEKFFNSASFELDYEGFHSNEELLYQAFQGVRNKELYEKLWRFGRYLFISGTDEKTNPFPMYGLWGSAYGLLWCHNMANINIQMIYWQSYVGNLLDYNKAFFRYFNDRMDIFRESAKKLFGMDGIFVTAGTTPGMAYPNQVVPVIMNWVSAAGWLCKHYYDYYRYTKDRKFLKEEILPFMEETAKFYEDFVTYDANGMLKFYPSVSPENTPGNFMPPEIDPANPMPHPMPTTVNSTMDLAILKEFFAHLIEISEEEQLYPEKIEGWKKIIRAIPEYKVSRDGGIREWQDERFDERYDHRHLSHIYPLFPGNEVSTVQNSEQIPAFRRAVDLRKIDTQTGWSLAYAASMYARLEEPEMAARCLENMTKSTVISNFFTLHNDWRGMNVTLNWYAAAVQLDANMGYVNAVQEMLLYTAPGVLKILPALPEFMDRGRVRDFRYFDGFVDLDWNLKKGTVLVRIRAVRKHAFKLQMFRRQCDWAEFQVYGTGETHRIEEGFLLAEMEENGELVIIR